MNRPGKTYIAGPMTGLPDHNYPAFHKAELELLDRMVCPVNPASEFGTHTDIPWYICLAACADRIIRECSAIYLLPGWSNSRGARIEWLIAMGLGLDVEKAPGAEYPPPELTKYYSRAMEIVYGDRERDYGHPAVDFTRQLLMARLSGIRMRKLEDVPLFMILVKISRQTNAEKPDNLVDICGYSLTIRRCRESYGHSFKRPIISTVREFIWRYMQKRLHTRKLKLETNG